MSSSSVWSQILTRLTCIYGADRAPAIHRDLQTLVAKYQARPATPSSTPSWDSHTAMLITYGDSLLNPPQSPLAALQSFLQQSVGPLIPWVHLLPFYPFSSDDGFAVQDFRAVNPALGNWADIQSLAQNFTLVFDGVINHVSASGTYAKGYLSGDPAFKDFFISLPQDTDTSAVLRTRNLPLLHDYLTPDGTKYLWTTFSRDQLDLNFANPAVLLEIADVLLFYAAHGAGVIRLDAIPYLWKQLGTSCAHLPQTHELIKLFRDLYDLAAPHMLLLTETNNPHVENITYFGNQGDEAQMVYNFTLAPLILFSLVTGNASTLTSWARQIKKISDRATFLNVTATHDGIGMRPTEGILTEPQRKMLVDLAYAHQGDMTGKRNSDGSVSPYELNLNYFDAVNDPNSPEPLAIQIDRFLLSQAIPLAFIGIPGIYIHSLLGSRNDLAGVKRTGRARSINREQLALPDLTAALADPTTLRHQVFHRYTRMLQIRATQPAFHPNADQLILDFGPNIFALRRTCPTQTILSLHNMTPAHVTLTLDAPATDVLAGNLPCARTLALAPYQVRWLAS